MVGLFSVHGRQRYILRQCFHYGVALAAVPCAFWARGELQRIVGGPLPPFIIFYPVVMVIALLGGTGPGLLATILTTLTSAYLIFPWPQPSPADQLSLVFFAVFCLCMTAGAALYRRNRRMLARYERDSALRETDERYSDFFQKAAVGAAELGMDGHFIGVNDHLCRITGYSREEMLGMTPAELTHPEDRQREDQRLEAYLHGDNAGYQAEKRYLRKDGAVIWVQVTAAMVRDADGTPLRSAAIIQDISERKLAEERLSKTAVELQTAFAELSDSRRSAINLMEDALEARQKAEEASSALQESEERLRTISDQIPGGAIYQHVLCPDGSIKYSYMSAGIEKLFGVSARDVMADPAVFLDLVVEEDRQRVADTTEESEREMKPFECEFRQRTVTGETRWVQCRSMPRSLEDGFTVWDGVVMDITERKRAEEALRSNADRLAAVLEAQRAIAGANLDHAALLQLILERMSSLLAADGACMEITESDEMVYEAATGLAAGFVGLRLKTARSLSGLSMVGNQLLNAADTETDPRVDRSACRRIGLRSMIVLPLQYDEHSFGVLKLMSSRVGAFNADAEDTLLLMGEFLGATIARRRTLAALRESEERLRLFIEHAPASLAMFDRGMRYLAVSRRWLNEYGLEERDLAGLSHYEVFPEITDKWKEFHRRCLAGEVLRSAGDRFERADGSAQWLRWEIRPWFEASGGIGGLVVFSEDITHLKLAEEALRRYELLAGNSRDIILFMRREDGRILEANRAAMLAYGYDHDELLAMSVHDLRGADTLQLSEEQMAEADREGILFETVHRRRDGSLFPVEVSSRGATISGGRMLISVIRDVTERAQAVAVIRESEGMLRHAEEMAHLGHWRLELATGRLVWSDEMYRIFGLERDEAASLLTVEKAVNFCLSEDREVCYRAHQPPGEESVTAFEYRIRRPDGEERHLVSEGEPLRDGNGAVTAMFGTVLDVTEIRRHERELREKNAELERFTYMISHDLKSPLVTIKAFLGYLEKDLGSSDRERINADMQYICTAADKMGRLLEELLEMSRIGRMSSVSVSVAFRELAGEAQELVAGGIAERGVEVVVGDGDVTLHGDRRRLVEIWQNLLENAVKFMDDQPAPRIQMGLERRGGDTVFFVRDNGIGIDPRYHDKVFGLFEKLNPAIDGTGLGLALVRRIVELYRGAIWVESAGAGCGSCFKFTLPDAVKADGTETVLSESP